MNKKTYETGLLIGLMYHLDVFDRGNSHFWIVGGYAKYLKGEVESFKDVDVIIPLGHNEWLFNEIDQLFGEDHKRNKFGGTRFSLGGVDIDIWTLDSMGLPNEATEKQIKEAMPLKEGQTLSILKIEKEEFT